QETHHQETLRRLAAFGFQPDRFAAHVIDNFFYQSLAYGLYHADIHPANLMILPGNVVGYLDLGITGTLSPYSRRHLAALTLACTRGDLEGMAAAFQRISSADAAAAQRYCAGLARLSDSWYERAGVSLRLRKSFTVVMLEMLKLSREADAWAQRDVIKYIRSSIALEGLVTRCAPGSDLSHQVEQACGRYLAQSMEAAPGGRWAGSAASPRQLIEVGLRAVTLLERAGGSEAPVNAEPGRSTAIDRLRPLSVAALVLLLTLTVRGEPATLDTFTAQALLLAAAIGGWSTRLMG
ncbi:MAG: AarF/UbiB family protein, partial [Acidobacteriota bacterium]